MNGQGLRRAASYAHGAGTPTRDIEFGKPIDAPSRVSMAGDSFAGAVPLPSCDRPKFPPGCVPDIARPTLPDIHPGLFFLTTGQCLVGNFFTARKPASDPRGDGRELYESGSLHGNNHEASHVREVVKVCRR